MLLDEVVIWKFRDTGVPIGELLLFIAVADDDGDGV